jgi:photosystem II stability/assembly factor-like uncharacterized protein
MSAPTQAGLPSLITCLAICVLSLGIIATGCKKDNTSTNNPPDPTNNRSLGIFVETHNRGDSWSGKDSLLFAKNLYSGSFTFIDSIFLVVGQDTANKAVIWASTDNGFHWAPALTTSNQGAFEDLTHTQLYTQLVAVGSVGIYRSTNHGLAWTLRTGVGDLKAVDFFERSAVGVAVGAGGTILRSADNGSTWTAVSSGTTQDLFGVHCINTALSDTIVAAGAAATIVRSTDAGLTWTVTMLPRPTILKAVSFSGNSVGRYGVTVGNGGVIFRTTNGGITWEDKTGNTSGNYEDVRVSDDGTLALAVFNQTGPHVAFFFSSTNTGSTWSNLSSVGGAYLFKLVFRTFNASDPYGFAVGIPNY